MSPGGHGVTEQGRRQNFRQFDADANAPEKVELLVLEGWNFPVRGEAAPAVLEPASNYRRFRNLDEDAVDALGEAAQGLIFAAAQPAFGEDHDGFAALQCGYGFFEFRGGAAKPFVRHPNRLKDAPGEPT